MCALVCAKLNSRSPGSILDLLTFAIVRQLQQQAGPMYFPVKTLPIRIRLSVATMLRFAVILVLGYSTCNRPTHLSVSASWVDSLTKFVVLSPASSSLSSKSLPSTTTSPASSTQKVTNPFASSTGSSTSTGVNSKATTTSVESSSGLSVGAKAGIGAGVAGCVLVAALGYTFWRLRNGKKAKKEDVNTTIYEKPAGWDIQPHPFTRSELDSQPSYSIPELSSHPR